MLLLPLVLPLLRVLVLPLLRVLVLVLVLVLVPPPPPLVGTCHHLRRPHQLPQLVPVPLVLA
jgi:hypothetical protein